MRLISRRHAPIATAALAAVLLTGCSEIQEVNNAVDKVQACAEAAKIATDLAGKVVGLATDPAALEKALNEAAANLRSTAEKAGNTTLEEAANGLAKTYESITVENANNAVDAAQKVVTDTAQHVSSITAACG
ncbi:hypothetical protein SAMN05421505_101294 [Sinosporangium album]|uniref:Uncharacterized protein n=1 Tax=Sinosporangium album TaxID=504805 RepID=A0A1G7RA37_9ACTN|nr:hypothetical protein [Sinosporangium album]SDG06850.1 hypothetical protein SAMN05421505_101294 [Sinosporangium album]